jgi:hypothetical protein
MDPSVYKRPNKPRTLTVNKREGAPDLVLPDKTEIVTVDRATECHVTPPDVAQRMVSYLGPVGDFLTMEPSAGTGNLIQALYDSGHSRYELVAIERHTKLCSEIIKRFSGKYYNDPINRCFLEYAQEAAGKIQFPRIIMNPPFRQVKQHVKAALTLLGPGGHDVATLVALVPITFEHPDAETLEQLPDDTFSTAKVRTKIIRIEY